MPATHILFVAWQGAEEKSTQARAWAKTGNKSKSKDGERRFKAVIYHPPRQADEAIIHFELANLLSEDQTLALNTRLGTLTLLTQDTASARPTVLVEQQFTSGEMNILLPLFQNHPHYCRYEVILASFNTGSCTWHTTMAASGPRSRGS